MTATPSSRWAVLRIVALGAMCCLMSEAWDFCPGRLFDPQRTLVDCTSNHPENCPCDNQTSSVCCVQRGVVETWSIRTLADRDEEEEEEEEADQEEGGGSHTSKADVVDRLFAAAVDIPLCPHAYLDLGGLTSRHLHEFNSAGVGVSSKTSAAAATAIAPPRILGYYLTGDPIYPNTRPDALALATFLTSSLRTRSLVGYAVDGFPIYGGGPWPGDHELDVCNGVLSPGEQGVRYAYYITINASHAMPPYIPPCLVSGADLLLCPTIRVIF